MVRGLLDAQQECGRAVMSMIPSARVLANYGDSGK